MKEIICIKIGLAHMWISYLNFINHSKLPLILLRCLVILLANWCLGDRAQHSHFKAVDNRTTNSSCLKVKSVCFHLAFIIVHPLPPSRPNYIGDLQSLNNPPQINWIVLTRSTHSPPCPNLFFWKPITDMNRTLDNSIICLFPFWQVAHRL